MSESIEAQNIKAWEEQAREARRYFGERLVLGHALEDALCELARVHGVGYLDTFLERRLQRSIEVRRRQAAGIPEHIRPHFEQLAEDGEAILREVVETVRQDPNSVQ